MTTKSIWCVGLAACLFACPASSQDAASLRSTIEQHYAAINSGDIKTAITQHRPEMSIFFWDGRLLTTGHDLDAAQRQGVAVDVGDANVFINNFSAQIYGSVGVATFYLVGSYVLGEEVERGTWRVTAVRVHEDGVWREAHHHESPLGPGMGM